MMRHGRAADPIQFNQEDHLRPLTMAGKQEIEGIAKTVAKNVGAVPVVISSPFLRTRQTMEAVRKYFAHDPEYMEVDMLTPDCMDHKRLLSFLKSLNVESVFYTGHQPQIEGFVQYLLADEVNVGFQVGTGSLHCVAFSDREYVSPGSGKLLLSVPSSFLKAV